MSIRDFLRKVIKNTEQTWKRSQSVLSFEQYLCQVAEKPHCHVRNSAHYFVDMIDSFGSYAVSTPTEILTRYRLFDAEFLEFEGRIFGQERIQHAIVEQLRSFVKQGRIDKLILLHGPNGSAKTSIIQAITRAAEHYSYTDDGALYQFSWVFPKKEMMSGSLGFSQNRVEARESYAHLPNDAVEARMPCDQRDHPLLLLSVAERHELFASIRENHQEKPLRIPVVLESGELSRRNRQIFDALLSSYDGDLEQVLRHVRVERFYLSGRFQRGIAAVEPQMSVDAAVRQITSDQSLMALPGSLRHLSLHESFGPLVEANRGMIEYSDLLKRPIDAWKYLLVACEQAQVSLGTMSLFFDLVLVATSNELHLNSFKDYPDWPSFKGRIELIRVPYLLRSHDEKGIYERQIATSLHGVHVAPHAIEMAARWAVLTRLEPPSVTKYPTMMQEVIRDISPEEKLALYNDGEVPLRLNQMQARELKALIPELSFEYSHEANYEGRYGASPREIRTLILKAAQDRRYGYVSPAAIFEQIEQLSEERSSYDFLRREPLRGYHDAKGLLAVVKQHYLQILADEARLALGLYSKESYLDLFTRYILHVSAWTKKEKLVDPVFGRRVEADESFMHKIESNLLAQNEAHEEFRRQLISQIAASKLENPNNDLDYSRIFCSQLRRLKLKLYANQNEVVARIISCFLNLNNEERLGEGAQKDMLQAYALREGLLKLGYTNESSRWAMAYLLQNGNSREKINKSGQPGLNLS